MRDSDFQEVMGGTVKRAQPKLWKERPSLTLSKSEVEAVISFIFMHSRGNPEGKAWKVRTKMQNFLTGSK